MKKYISALVNDHTGPSLSAKGQLVIIPIHHPWVKLQVQPLCIIAVYFNNRQTYMLADNETPAVTFVNS
jgi:hypothetical protein